MQEGIVPDDFRQYFERWEEHGPAVNASIKCAEKIDAKNGDDLLKIVIETPWPLWNRVMYCSRYLEMDLEDGGNLMLFSS